MGVGRPGPSIRARRLEAWAEELAFWEHWLATGGFNWPDDYRRKTDPRAPVVIPRRYLPRAVRSPLRLLPGRRPRISILDVGAGPLSIVGTRLRGAEVELTAVDPLAEEYAELLARHRVEPPVATTPLAAEELAEGLGESRFDVVHCQNALDHAEDPLAGLEQMTRVVKPGHWVVLKHTVDEAETEGYAQLHDWNFNIERGRLLIWNRERRIHPDEHLPLAERVEVEFVEEDGYRWVRAAVLRAG